MIDETYYRPFIKGKAIIREYKNNTTQCYCINTLGELLFKFPIGIWIDAMGSDNVFIVSDFKANKMALFDSNGKQLTDFTYQQILGESEEVFFVALKGDKWGYISLQGKEILPFIYDKVNDFNEGIASVCQYNKWGMIDYNGNTVIPFIYDEIGSCYSNFILARYNEKYGIVDKFNNTIIDFIYDDIAIINHRSCGSMPAKIGKQYGIIDIYGKTIFNFIYDDIKCIDNDGCYYAIKKSNKWALYSCLQNIFISSFMYDDIGFKSLDLFSVKLNGKWSYINSNNHPISDFIYVYIGDFFHDRLSIVSLNGKMGAINTDGKIVIPIQYYKLKTCSEGYLIVKDNDLGQYIIDKNNNVVIPKKTHQRFHGNVSCGFVATSDGYLNMKNEKLNIKL